MNGHQLIRLLLERISIALEQKKNLNEDHAIGRSKGGLSTKIHATCDALGNPTGFHLTPGQAHDLEGADALMDEITQSEALTEEVEKIIFLADKGFTDPVDSAAQLHYSLKTRTTGVTSTHDALTTIRSQPRR